MPTTGVFFFVSQGLVISEPHAMVSSPRSFDVQLSTLAKNENALDTLKLLSNMAKYKEEALSFFAFYLAAFNTESKEKHQEMMLKDPIVRVLVENDGRRATLCELLNVKPNKQAKLTATKNGYPSEREEIEKYIDNVVNKKKEAKMAAKLKVKKGYFTHIITPPNDIEVEKDLMDFDKALDKR